MIASYANCAKDKFGEMMKKDLADQSRIQALKCTDSIKLTVN